MCMYTVWHMYMYLWHTHIFSCTCMLMINTICRQSPAWFTLACRAHSALSTCCNYYMRVHVYTVHMCIRFCICLPTDLHVYIWYLLYSFDLYALSNSHVWTLTPTNVLNAAVVRCLANIQWLQYSMRVSYTVHVCQLLSNFQQVFVQV